ncbi:sugar ABC transporter ATP-binding protein [Aerococcaceae bacterium INB8]|uniref:Sugar ABC transporter ATP-binding protein n=1 Tax=Ruoffia halotolerans TaxID=2748684 RepID=A0A839A2Q6_9LACT|nr:sugar ABC transporter ATP-binding protein [Ruoffia halotolerans]MBA5728419.1 sugar ABC transporter ATP-binding protein [Ruoffia halotolerans]
MNPVAEMKQITKSFGQNHVLKNVDFTLMPGSIHALLGENGTGKTTLMNILGSIIPKDSGSIKLFGEAYESNEMNQQVAFIHQELSLVNDLTVFENVYLGRELRKSFFLDKQKMIEETQHYIELLDVALKPTQMVSSLNPALKQITEILRAVMQEARIIIMDEPTSSLTDVEIDHVFNVIRNLRENGVSIIFISHKLNEVLEICDAYTIMRDGNVVATGEVTPDLTEAMLSRHMVGRELSTEVIYRERPLGSTILELANLSKEREYKDINMTLKKGEILGVTGLLGDGRSELFMTVAGANMPYSGSMIVNQKTVKLHNTTQAMRSRITYVPKNRKENGIITDLSIKENMTLPILKNFYRNGLLNNQAILEHNQCYIQELFIKISDVNHLITSLSGGNQQKVVLARALGTNPDIVILDNPTQGVDVGAKLEIYTLIMKLAEEGISFVILSSEFPEMHNLCDRVYVMFQGQVRGEFTREELNEEDIMLVATGGSINGRD